MKRSQKKGTSCDLSSQVESLPLPCAFLFDLLLPANWKQYGHLGDDGKVLGFGLERISFNLVEAVLFTGG